MALDDEPWLRAWKAFAEERKANAPQRAAGRAAYRATMPLKGRPRAEVRVRLEAEMTARGVTDLPPDLLDLLVEAVQTSPNHVAVAQMRLGLGGLRRLFNEAKLHATPSWTNSPSYVQRIEDWREDQEVNRAIVDLDPNSGETVARIYAEVPHAWGIEEDGSALPRAFSCWLSAEPSDNAAQTLTVRVGKHALGQLNKSDAAVVRQLLDEFGWQGIEFDAAALGDNPESPLIHIGLPDRI